MPTCRFNHFTAMLLVVLLGFTPGVPLLAGESANPMPARYILDMVQDNPGEPLQSTAFRDPQKLAAWGYNGQVIEAGADSSETFAAIDPTLLPQGDPARSWIEQRAKSLAELAENAHRANLKAYAWMQFVLLPKAVVARFKDEICDTKGRIDLERPMTQKLLRAQIAELFARCPALDGLGGAHRGNLSARLALSRGERQPQ
jgi:hypothetical protein